MDSIVEDKESRGRNHHGVASPRKQRLVEESYHHQSGSSKLTRRKEPQYHLVLSAVTGGAIGPIISYDKEPKQLTVKTCASETGSCSSSSASGSGGATTGPISTSPITSDSSPNAIDRTTVGDPNEEGNGGDERK